MFLRFGSFFVWYKTEEAQCAFADVFEVVHGVWWDEDHIAGGYCFFLSVAENVALAV